MLTEILIMKTETKIFLTFFLLYSFFAQWNDEWDAANIFGLIRAIVEEKRFEIDSFVNTTPVRFFSRISPSQGHWYSILQPGQSFIGSSIYGLWKFLFNFLPQSFRESSEPITYNAHGSVLIYYQNPGFLIESSRILLTILTTALPAALSVYLFYKACTYFSKNKTNKLLTTLTYGLGTSIFPYGVSFYNYALSTFFSFLSFFILFRAKKKEDKKRCSFLAGLISGYAFITNSVTFVISLFLTIYTYLIEKRMTLVFIFGFSLSVLPLLLYNILTWKVIYFHPLNLLFSHFIYKTPLFKKYEFGEKPSGWLLPYKAFPYQIPIRLLMFPYRGLFFYYPILLLSFFSLAKMMSKKRMEASFIISIFLTLILLYTTLEGSGKGLIHWWGDFGFGPRRFVLVMPFLSLPLVCLLEDGFNRKIFLFFLLISLFINLLGLQVWEGHVEDYVEKMKKWQPLGNPLFERYIPLFLKNGPRSPFLEHLLLEKKLSIWNAPQVCSAVSDLIPRSRIYLLTLPSTGFITLRVSFLPLAFMLAFFFLIWGKEIFQWFDLNSRQKLFFLFSLSLGLVLLFVNVTDFLYKDNWYAPQEDGRWMSQDASILIFCKKEGEKATIKFEVESFAKKRILQVFLNEKLLGEFVIENGSKTLVSLDMELKRDKNKLLFHSKEGCEAPSEVNLQCDVRCLSFKFANFQRTL